MSDLKSHWNGFLNAVGSAARPTDNNCVVFENTSSKIGVSGFLDLKPDNTIKPNYDAMNSTWLGVEASNKAFLSQKSVSTAFMPFQSSK